MRGKGVVVEIAKRNKITVMTSQGEFVQVPFKKQVCIGQEVQFVQKERINIWQLSVAAVLLVALAGSWGLINHEFIPGASATAFIVTLDINPSVELAVDRKHAVLSAEGLNNDGTNLLTKVQLLGKKLEDALELIGNQALTDGFLKNGQNEIIVTIASKEDRDVTLSELKDNRTGAHSQIEKVIQDTLSTKFMAQVRIWQVPMTIQSEAKLAGIRPSRYIAIHTQAQAIVPQKREVRLTIAEQTEQTEPQNYRESATQTTTARFGNRTERPTLTPVQWTNNTTAHAYSSRAYKVPLAVDARAKGAFSIYE